MRLPAVGRNDANIYLIFMNKISNYLKEVRLELAKVNWPSRDETIRYTAVVIGVSVALALFLGGLDYVFSWLLNRFIL